MRNQMMIMTVVAAGLGCTSMPIGAATQAIPSKTQSHFINGCAVDLESLRSLCWTAAVDRYPDGANAGISVEWTDAEFIPHRIECSGPSYANGISVEHSKGDSRLYAVLDPLSPDCTSFDVSSTVTLSFSGAGELWLSQSGHTRQLGEGFSYRYNFQIDCFQASFVGTINVPGFAGFQGGSCVSRYTNLVKYQ